MPHACDRQADERWSFRHRGAPAGVRAALAWGLAALAGCGSEDGDLIRPEDSVPPSISIMQPADGATVATDQPVFVVRLEDDETGVFPGTISARIDSRDVSSTFLNGYDDSTGEVRVAGLIRLEGGPHVLSFSVSDAAGNRGTATAEFTIRVPPPGGGT